MKKIDNWHDRQTPEKSWGREEWIVNNDLYCGKKLHFDLPGGQTSLHFHVRKHETMYVEKGIFHIYIIDQTTVKLEMHTLGVGDSITIEPGTIHRIRAAEAGSVLVEFSTHHEDSDSYRVER